MKLATTAASGAGTDEGAIPTVPAAPSTPFSSSFYTKHRPLFSLLLISEPHHNDPPMQVQWAGNPQELHERNMWFCGWGERVKLAPPSVCRNPLLDAAH